MNSSVDASLPGIAILKLFAWADRGQENPKDAMVSAQTSRDLRDMLNGAKRGRLVEDMARAMLGKDNALAYSHRLLEQFTNGLIA